MREIKFRAYHNSTQKMVYFSLYNPLEFPNKPWNQYEIMQFTGLEDKNGKEIYEGDIVKVVNGMDNEIGLVEWYTLKWKINWDYAKNLSKYDYSLTCKDDLEIIGNIYENPNYYKH